MQQKFNLRCDTKRRHQTVENQGLLSKKVHLEEGWSGLYLSKAKLAGKIDHQWKQESLEFYFDSQDQLYKIEFLTMEKKVESALEQSWNECYSFWLAKNIFILH
jgi:hypothetical protein